MKEPTDMNAEQLRRAAELYGLPERRQVAEIMARAILRRRFLPERANIFFHEKNAIWLKAVSEAEDALTALSTEGYAVVRKGAG